uniref:Uncharacterized protein n=1 Tax=Timspurckia oligopyrenoides TaxID=708627 RepID=A0A7S1ET35_9RHOD
MVLGFVSGFVGSSVGLGARSALCSELSPKSLVGLRKNKVVVCVVETNTRVANGIVSKVSVGATRGAFLLSIFLGASVLVAQRIVMQTTLSQEKMVLLGLLMAVPGVAISSSRRIKEAAKALSWSVSGELQEYSARCWFSSLLAATGLLVAGLWNVGLGGAIFAVSQLWYWAFSKFSVENNGEVLPTTSATQKYEVFGSLMCAAFALMTNMLGTFSVLNAALFVTMVVFYGLTQLESNLISNEM